MPRSGIHRRRLLGSSLAAALMPRSPQSRVRSAMNRNSSNTVQQVAWLMLAAGLASMSGGCQLLHRKNEEVIQVASQRNTLKATRLTYLGIHSLHKGHIALAAKRFREAVAADYAYGPAHNNLGLMHYEQGNLYQAVIAFEQAREYLPGDPSAVYNLALALEAAGRTPEALELYYEASEMDPTEPLFLGNLVRIRLRMGENDELLQQQLRDLVLIERRPEWRRWADTQLALNVNNALDRGPSTPDLETTFNERDSDQKRTDVRDKIIDLTPVSQVSLEEEAPDLKSVADPPSAPDVETLPESPPTAILEETIPETMPEILPEPKAANLPPPSGPLIRRPNDRLRESRHEELSEADYYRN